MLTEAERDEIHRRLQELQLEEERRHLDDAARREHALGHTGGRIIDLRDVPRRMR